MCDGSEFSKFFSFRTSANFKFHFPAESAFFSDHQDSDFAEILKIDSLPSESEILFRILGSKFEKRKFQFHISRTAA